MYMCQPEGHVPVCAPRGSPVALCPRARSAERIAGPVACRPECTETYISLPGRLTTSQLVLLAVPGIDTEYQSKDMYYA